MSRSLLTAALALALCGCPDELPPPDPKQKAEGLYVMATAHYLQGNFDEALKALDQSRALNPDDPRLAAQYGEIYLSQGKLKEALEKFEEAARRDPKRNTNWSRLGYIQAQLGRREEARSSFRKALALFPQDFNALEQLGELELKEGKFDEAVKHLVAAAEVAPDLNKPSLYGRAVDALLKTDRRPEAALLLKTAVSRNPALPGEVYARLGELLVLEGDMKAALEAYRAAAMKLPRDPIPWELVGELYMAMDKPGDAEAAWRESLKIADRSVVHVQLARMHLKRKDQAAAQEHLDKALAAATGEELREGVELAELLVEMKRKPDALKLLAALASEEESAKEADLQLRTARLAKELKEQATLDQACARALDAGVKKCP